MSTVDSILSKSTHTHTPATRMHITHSKTWSFLEKKNLHIVDITYKNSPSSQRGSLGLRAILEKKQLFPAVHHKFTSLTKLSPILDHHPIFSIFTPTITNPTTTNHQPSPPNRVPRCQSTNPTTPGKPPFLWHSDQLRWPWPFAHWNPSGTVPRINPLQTVGWSCFFWELYIDWIEVWFICSFSGVTGLVLWGGGGEFGCERNG